MVSINITFIDNNQTVTNILMMSANYKITELFCIADDFCKHFEAEKGNCYPNRGNKELAHAVGKLKLSPRLHPLHVFM